MNEQELLAYVSTVTGTDRDRSERITRAFLETLGARLPNAEAADLAAQLPEGLKSSLHPTAPEVEKLTMEEFLTRFAREADISNDQAPRMAGAVWQALEQSVSAGELEQVRQVLPKEFVAVFR